MMVWMGKANLVSVVEWRSRVLLTTATSAPMTVHFVCTGNIYRSRLAEAYCASRCRPALSVFSSGIGAGLNNGVRITPYASRLLKERGLESFAAVSRQQTTAGLVHASDVLIFMEQEHFRFCEDWIDSGRQTVEIWNIADIRQKDAAAISIEVEQTFAAIQQRTDCLLTSLCR